MTTELADAVRARLEAGTSAAEVRVLRRRLVRDVFLGLASLGMPVLVGTYSTWSQWQRLPLLAVGVVLAVVFVMRFRKLQSSGPRAVSADEVSKIARRAKLCPSCGALVLPAEAGECMRCGNLVNPMAVVIAVAAFLSLVIASAVWQSH